MWCIVEVKDVLLLADRVECHLPACNVQLDGILALVVQLTAMRAPPVHAYRCVTAQSAQKFRIKPLWEERTFDGLSRLRAERLAG